MQLISKKITLRDWEAVDLEEYRKWNTGSHVWMDFDGPYYPPLEISAIERFSAECLKTIESGDWPIPRQKMVIANVEENKLIGLVSWYWQSEETNWKSIGIVIYDPENWSKGIGFEALSLWINYLFESDPDLMRLDLRTWGGNGGMIRLAEKLGFTEEARFRKARKVRGEYFDSVGMGILREEWDSKASYP
ncbi:MAG: GNAT family N-acetyltransferase [Bacteroidia bacterium]|nr:GNAT family N-acetyltransferase [Bacteroidia bacterium]